MNMNKIREWVKTAFVWTLATILFFGGLYITLVHPFLG